MKNVFQQNLICMPSRYTTHRTRTRPCVYHLINYLNCTIVSNFAVTPYYRVYVEYWFFMLRLPGGTSNFFYRSKFLDRLLFALNNCRGKMFSN